LPRSTDIMPRRLNSEAETRTFAARLAERLKPGDVVALEGALGAGKSVFARSLMHALGVTDTAMPSPTFSLIQEYEGRGCRIAHMDWYRLEDAGEVAMLGVTDYFRPPWICLIEWPDRAADVLPAHVWRIRLETVTSDPAVRLVSVQWPQPAD